MPHFYIEKRGFFFKNNVKTDRGVAKLKNNV